MAKGHNVTQDAAKSPQDRVKSPPVRHLSLESAKELRGLASRSPEN